MDLIENSLRRAGGISSSRDLLNAGVSGRQLRVALDEGRIRRVRRGLLALPDADVDRLIAARLGARLGGLSAASSYGLWDGWDSRLHLVVPPNAGGVPPPGEEGCRRVDGRVIVVHWSDDRRGGSAWRVPVGRCLAQILHWHDVETAVATIESALTTKMLSVDHLPRLAAGLTPPVARVVLGLRPGAQSGLETIVRLRLESLGFVVQAQASVTRVGHVDLRIVGTRVVIELDGYAFHSGRAEFTEDRRRDAEAASQGLVVLRFTADHVHHCWAWAERVILDTVASVG